MTEPRFDIRRDPVLGEEVWLATTDRGVQLRVVPSDRFREAVAVVAVGYGSTDLGFTSDGAVHDSPEGVAHYLEHKLFEDEDLHVFDRFGRRGARVNAMTGFTRTQYYFQGTTAFEDNLADLLRLTARAHLTDENVEKERGIIAQELRMYEDHPEYRGFFALLRRLYAEHPARHPVGGTVESIAGIDVAELTACHRAFYRSGNVMLAAAGPIDPAQVFAAASAWDLREGAAPDRNCPSDLGPADGEPGVVDIALARPRLLLGLKERSLVEDAAARTVRELTTRILLDALFGPASEIREDLHRRDVVDDSLSASYMSERTFGFVVVGAESDRPEAVADEIRAILRRPIDLAPDHLERIGRRVLGSYVRSFDSLRSLAFGHCDEGLEGLEPFGTLDRLRSITSGMVEERRRELCRDDSFAQIVLRG